MELTAWLPIYAYAKFEAEIDIEGKREDQIREEFYQACVSDGYLCHHCCDHIQTEFDINDAVVDVDEFEFEND